MEKWLIGAVLGGVGLLVLLKPGKAFAAGSSPTPPKNPPQGSTGTPNFTLSGAGNTIRTVGGVVGGIADIVSQITGKGIIPNLGSLAGPQQAVVSPVSSMNTDGITDVPMYYTDVSGGVSGGTATSASDPNPGDTADSWVS